MRREHVRFPADRRPPSFQHEPGLGMVLSRETPHLIAKPLWKALFSNERAELAVNPYSLHTARAREIVALAISDRLPELVERIRDLTWC